MRKSKHADGRMVDTLSGAEPSDIESNLNRLFQAAGGSDSFKDPIKNNSSDHARGASVVGHEPNVFSFPRLLIDAF